MKLITLNLHLLIYRDRLAKPEVQSDELVRQLKIKEAPIWKFLLRLAITLDIQYPQRPTLLSIPES